MVGKTALITGATSGIGMASAELLASKGMKLILCGRREDRLNELKSKFDSQCQTLVFDVRDKKAVIEKIGSLPEPYKSIDILINNAGNAHGLEPVHEADLNDWDKMIDSNFKGLLYVTKAILPIMTSRNKGHIINIGSIAGKEVYPNGSVYCSSKFAVDSFTKGLRLDLNKFKIKVGVIHPGMVNTEFSQIRFKGDKIRANKVYQGLTPLSPYDVAEVIYYMIQVPDHVNIADILLLPSDQANTYINYREF